MKLSFLLKFWVGHGSNCVHAKKLVVLKGSWRTRDPHREAQYGSEAPLAVLVCVPSLPLMN